MSAIRESVESYTAHLSQEKQLMIIQYRALVALAQDMWRVLYDRTVYKEWEDDHEGQIEVGVGSCAIDRSTAELGISSRDLIRLRDIRNQQVSGQPFQPSPNRRYPVCEYHRDKNGCALDDLKSPVCSIYLPTRLEMEIYRRFGWQIAEQIEETLELLKHTLILQQNDRLVEKEKRRWRQKTERAIRTVMAQLEPFPVLAVR